MSFDFFEPPKSLLDRIGYVEPVPGKLYESSTLYQIFLDLSEINHGVASAICGLKAFIGPRWEIPLDEQDESIARSGTGMLVAELLRNGLCYGGKKQVHLGIFLGKEGICYGSRDLGDYFKSEEIKSAWESRDLEKIKRKELVDIRVGDTASGRGNGVRIINKSSDEIYVDGELGIIYCVQLKRRFVDD